MNKIILDLFHDVKSFLTDFLLQPRSFLFMKELKNVASPASSEGAEQESISAARNQTLEAERVKAVDAYRKIKATRTHSVKLTEFM